MTIACLGWGSLIWQPKELKAQRIWFNDGPFLPIEFTRKSDKGAGRITLIIDEAALPVRTLWTLMTTENLDIAIESLRIREGKTKKENIHSITKGQKTTNTIQSTVLQWLVSKNIDAAIWTGLSYFEPNKRPSIEDVITHISKLEYEVWKLAEEYVRKAPKQIDTEYRRQLERELGWTLIE